MAKINYSEIVFNNNSGDGNGIMQRFSLKNNGDEAIVRICHDDPSTFDLGIIHRTGEGRNYREVNCLRTPQQDTQLCPLCAAGMSTTQLIYIHLIEYTVGADGSVVATPKVWSRGISWARKLVDLMSEYGPFSQSLFKIKRSGNAGDTNTEYNIMFCNPQVYNNIRYPADAIVAFNGYSAFDKQVPTKSYEDMQYYVQYGKFPEKVNNATPAAQPTFPQTPTTPAYVPPINQPFPGYQAPQKPTAAPTFPAYNTTPYTEQLPSNATGTPVTTAVPQPNVNAPSTTPVDCPPWEVGVNTANTVPQTPAAPQAVPPQYQSTMVTPPKRFNV